MAHGPRRVAMHRYYRYPFGPSARSGDQRRKRSTNAIEAFGRLRRIDFVGFLSTAATLLPGASGTTRRLSRRKTEE
ncbi:hypothetical protein EJ04DRAFT_4654 [Polyplosphaeria fusca]|uniref:Uncharacterized protein n=1 Tax=Polyplosphaeria fusca TaxID=682080 RepID=A0A9P4R9C3_9PLEO|nr:hypothetical protein EJ04DRAFT_4654 [Polyplosphaeria fusca]